MWSGMKTDSSLPLTDSGIVSCEADFSTAIVEEAERLLSETLQSFETHFHTGIFISRSASPTAARLPSFISELWSAKTTPH